MSVEVLAGGGGLGIDGRVFAEEVWEPIPFVLSQYIYILYLSLYIAKVAVKIYKRPDQRQTLLISSIVA